MKIQKIEIYNFRGLSNVIINNLDKNLNLLIGINGSGKSSVLDAIALLLQSYTARLTSSSGKGISVSIYDIKKRSQGCKLFIDLANGVGWSRYRFRGLEKTEGGDLSRLYDYTYPLRISLDEEENISLPIIAHYGVNRAVTGMSAGLIMRRSMMTEETGKPSDTYKNWWNRGAIYRDFLLWFKEAEAEENRKRIEKPEYRSRGLQAIRDAMKVIFPEYSDMRMISSHQIGLRKNGDEYPLDILSDGEKCYLTLICDIVRRLTIANPTGEILKGNGIVLIDEIDLHLHPSWEATVMEKLHLVFQNIQFIVSAHSPLVASHFDGQVYGVKNGNVTSLPRLFGLDYSTILQEWMEAHPENREVNTLKDLYRTYKKYEMTEEAEACKQKLIELANNDLQSEMLRNFEW